MWAIVYFDDYTNDYFYSANMNNLWFGLLLSRSIRTTDDQLNKCTQQIEERQGVKVNQWKRLGMGMAVKDLNNPRLFVGDKILAGPLSGMHDSFIGFGTVAALLCGKIAALALKDKEGALEDFKRFNRNYERTWLSRKMFEMLSPNLRLSILEMAVANPEFFELPFLAIGAIIPGYFDNTWIWKAIVEEEGLPYFDKFKEELARVLQENMSRLF